MKVVRKGIPAKRHYSLNYTVLIEATINEAERKNVYLTKQHFQLGEKKRQQFSDKNLSITYNTPETTAIKHSTQSMGDVLSSHYGKL